MGFFVGLQGLEPWKTAPKTVVLPLHHRPVLLIASANLEQILFYTNKSDKKLKQYFNQIIINSRLTFYDVVFFVKPPLFA